MLWRFVGTQQSLEGNGLQNATSPPGAENPAGRLTHGQGDMIPLLRLLASGKLPGHLTPTAWRAPS